MAIARMYPLAGKIVWCLSGCWTEGYVESLTPQEEDSSVILIISLCPGLPQLTSASRSQQTVTCVKSDKVIFK